MNIKLFISKLHGEYYDIDTTIEILRYKQIKDYSTKGVYTLLINKQICSLQKKLVILNFGKSLMF